MNFDPTMSNLAIDSNNLTQLRTQAQKDPQQALKAAAQQFEAVFLGMMLKSMRDAMPQESPFDNEQTKMFTSMYDQQIAQNIASRSIGLAELMVRQLSNQAQSTPVAPPAPDTQPAPTATITNNTSTTLESTPSAIPSAFNQKTQQGFIQKMLPHAISASRNSGIPAQFILGQAALESGWGKREIPMPDGSSSHNLFGIKASSNWNGKVTEVLTTEYRNGIAYKQVEKFRAYDSYSEAFQDYSKLLRDNPRYANVLESRNLHDMAQNIQKSGYATDPKYAEKLVKVMNMIGG